MTLQLRAVGTKPEVDHLIALIHDSGLRMTRLHRDLEAREHPGGERAYLDLEPAPVNAEGSAA
ncbi:MAG TPA: hypothetical protein VK659_14635 [Asanoa sp.]|nr:hypothetical protein [Asanoa sp.]